MSKKEFLKPDLSIEQLSEELVITNLKLQQANQQLQQEQQARNEMFSNISHDLRTPVTAIKNSIALLSALDDYDSNTVQPIVHLMEQRVNTLEKMINDIFFLVSAENNFLSIHPEEIPLGFFLEDYFFSQEADCKYDDRHLHLALEEYFPYTLTIDPHQLQRILDNLFTNAWKYSKSGDSITLGAFCKDDTIFIYVEDTGIGIADAHLPNIFKRSYVVDSARTPGVSSTGLGLSITKALVELFDGTISCTSTLGLGSRFTIAFPLPQS